MMKSKIMFLVFVFTLFILVTRANAMLLPECSDEKYRFNNSHIVIDGEVENITIVQEANGSYEVVTVEAEKSLKGNIRGQIRIKQLSGVFEDKPEFMVDEKTRLYLTANADGTYSVFCLSMGKMGIGGISGSKNESVDDSDDEPRLEDSEKRTIEEAKERYERAKEVYEQAKEDYLRVRQLYLREKSEINLREVTSSVKEYLLASDKAMIDYLENLKQRVNLNEDIPADRKTEITSKIDGDISWLEAKQTEISGASTREELISLARQLRERWQAIKPREKIIVGYYLTEKVTGILKKADVISNRIEKIIERLKGEGKDTTRLEELLLSFNTHITEAQKARQSAREAFTNLDETQDTRINQGRQYLLEAQKHLRLSHKDLKAILLILKEYKVEEAKGEVNETQED